MGLIKKSDGWILESKNKIKYSLYETSTIGANTTPAILVIFLDDIDYEDALNSVINKTDCFVNYYFGVENLYSDNNKIVEEYVEELMYVIDKFEKEHYEIVTAIHDKMKSDIIAKDVCINEAYDIMLNEIRDNMFDLKYKTSAIQKLYDGLENYDYAIFIIVDCEVVILNPTKECNNYVAKYVFEYIDEMFTITKIIKEEN